MRERRCNWCNKKLDRSPFLNYCSKKCEKAAVLNGEEKGESLSFKHIISPLLVGVFIIIIAYIYVKTKESKIHYNPDYHQDKFEGNNLRSTETPSNNIPSKSLNPDLVELYEKPNNEQRISEDILIDNVKDTEELQDSNYTDRNQEDIVIQLINSNKNVKEISEDVGLSRKEIRQIKRKLKQNVTN